MTFMVARFEYLNIIELFPRADIGTLVNAFIVSVDCEKTSRCGSIDLRKEQRLREEMPEENFRAKKEPDVHVALA